jgi:phospholipid/cholesterol/gamma-HCH transport system substrate-binding protein
MFVIVSILVLAATTYLLRVSRIYKDHVRYRTLMTNAGGITPGADVLFGGMKVGNVTAVRPSPENPTRIEIAFQVQAGIPLNEKSTARISSISFVSNPILSITTGTEDARRLSPGELVPSYEALSTEDMTQRLASAADSAQELLSQLRKDLPPITRKADTLLTNLNQITSPENRRQIELILSGIRTLIDRESPKIARITNQFSELTKHANSVVASARPLVANANRAVGNLDTTIGNINSTVSNINSVVEGVREPLTKDLAELAQTFRQAQSLLASIQKLVGANDEEIAETIRNLRVSSENLQQLTEQLKQRPWSLIRITQPPDRKPPQ